MRMVFGLVLIVGVALAGGAVYLAKEQFGAYKNELARERAARQDVIPTVDVYVADRQLKYGEVIAKEDVRMVSWPENAIPEGAFIGEHSLYSETENDLRVALRIMEKDEAILAVKVSEPGEEAGITSRLERGMRAFAIRVDVASGVSGFLRPDDRVDIYWTGRLERSNSSSGGANSSEITKLIEAGVKLIAIDQSAAGDLSGAVIARTVTVSVRPEQVGALAQAQSTGSLSLSLVGTNDDTIAGAVNVDQRSLLGLAEREETIELAKEKVCTIRTRRGAEVLEIPIPCTN